MEHKYLTSDSRTEKYQTNVLGYTRIHLLALEMSLSENVWRGKGGQVRGMRGRMGEDGLPWCSFVSSHGIKMETVGFLALLSVICFLHNTHTQRNTQSQVFKVKGKQSFILHWSHKYDTSSDFVAYTKQTMTTFTYFSKESLGSPSSVEMDFSLSCTKINF